MSNLDGAAVDLNGDLIDGCISCRSTWIAYWSTELTRIDGEGTCCLFNAINKEFELSEVERRQRVLADVF